jgi:hypothetical protein
MLLLYNFYLFFYMLLISNSLILPLNFPFLFVWCYTVATFAHRVSAAYFVGRKCEPGEAELTEMVDKRRAPFSSARGTWLKTVMNQKVGNRRRCAVKPEVQRGSNLELRLVL